MGLLAEKKDLIDHPAFVEMMHSELSKIQDIELLVLKGQLLIEYALNQVIEKLLDQPSEKYNYNFFSEARHRRDARNL